jgi:dipeptidyl aminopeptidase/acylaminoacyl peptidase
MIRKITSLIPAVLVALLSPTHAIGADDSWTIERMLELGQVGGVQVSPDATKVVYVVRRAVMEGDKSDFVAQIHVANHDGTGNYPLTQAEHSSDAPQWSPDGDRIAFLSKRADKTQIWVIRLRGGEARRVTDARGGVVSFRWSPDGRRVAYVATDPLTEKRESQIKRKDDARVVDEQLRPNRLWVIDAGQETDKPEPRVLTKGDVSILGGTTPGFDWSPDGKTIVFTHVPSPSADDWTRSDLSVVDVGTAMVKPLVHAGSAESSPLFSPDGRSIAYVASDDPPTWAFDSALHVVAADGGNPRKLADSFDHRPELLGWTADGQQLLFRENQGTTTRLYSLALAGEPQEIGPVDGVVAEASLNPTGIAIGFSFQTADQPTEAFSIRLARPELVQASRVNTWARDLPVGRTEVTRWQTKDGKTIDGLLTYPVGYAEGQRCPLLVVIHGGPTGVFTRTFIASPVTPTSDGRYAATTYPLAAFAARGYAILRCNVRGSSGYGKEFRHANHKDWGGGDYQDLMAGVDHVIAMGVADPDRLGVMGWSYGGYLTSWAISHTRRFKAASVLAGVTDLVSFSGTSDIHSFLPSYFGGEPWDRAELYREHSPISHAKGVNTPTLIQHGEEDERVPITQGYELYNALKRQGCRVKMVVYPRSHHAIQEPKLILDAMQRNLDWFDEHLGRSDTTVGTR